MESLPPNGQFPSEHSSTTKPTDDGFAAASISCGDDLLGLSAHAPIRLMFGPVVRLASAARRTGTPPERLVSTLKGLLQQTPRLASFEPDEREHTTDDLVSLSIEVFFDGDEDDPQARRDDAA